MKRIFKNVMHCLKILSAGSIVGHGRKSCECGVAWPRVSCPFCGDCSKRFVRCFGRSERSGHHLGRSRCANIAVASYVWAFTSVSHYLSCFLYLSSCHFQLFQIRYITRVNCLGFTADSQYAISASHDRTIRIWHAPSGLLQKTMHVRFVDFFFLKKVSVSSFSQKKFIVRDTMEVSTVLQCFRLAVML